MVRGSGLQTPLRSQSVPACVAQVHTAALHFVRKKAPEREFGTNFPRQWSHWKSCERKINLHTNLSTFSPSCFPPVLSPSGPALGLRGYFNLWLTHSSRVSRPDLWRGESELGPSLFSAAFLQLSTVYFYLLYPRTCAGDTGLHRQLECAHVEVQPSRGRAAWIVDRRLPLCGRTGNYWELPTDSRSGWHDFRSTLNWILNMQIKIKCLLYLVLSNTFLCKALLRTKCLLMASDPAERFSGAAETVEPFLLIVHDRSVLDTLQAFSCTIKLHL